MGVFTWGLAIHYDSYLATILLIHTALENIVSIAIECDPPA